MVNRQARGMMRSRWWAVGGGTAICAEHDVGLCRRACLGVCGAGVTELRGCVVIPLAEGGGGAYSMHRTLSIQQVSAEHSIILESLPDLAALINTYKASV